jgi:hypothetical protein
MPAYMVKFWVASTSDEGGDNFWGLNVGESFPYWRVKLGDFIAFVGAGNIILEYIVGGAAVTCGWMFYFVTLINKDPSQLQIEPTSLLATINLP